MWCKRADVAAHNLPLLHWFSLQITRSGFKTLEVRRLGSGHFPFFHTQSKLLNWSAGTRLRELNESCLHRCDWCGKGPSLPRVCSLHVTNWLGFCTRMLFVSPCATLGFSGFQGFIFTLHLMLTHSLDASLHPCWPCLCVCVCWFIPAALTLLNLSLPSEVTAEPLNILICSLCRHRCEILPVRASTCWCGPSLSVSPPVIQVAQFYHQKWEQ